MNEELKQVRREMLSIFSSVIPTPETGYTGEPHMMASDARAICRELKTMREAVRSLTTAQQSAAPDQPQP